VAKDLTMNFWLQLRMKKFIRVGIGEKGGGMPLFFIGEPEAKINPQGSGESNVEVF